MSMLGPSATAPVEVGEVVASFPAYEGAQKAVSALIAAEVPAKDIAIVGQQLRSIEKVTGRLGYATAARSGAINGILLGVFFSIFIVFGNPDAPIQLFLGLMLVGIAVGMLLSIVSYSIIRRRRDFASVMQVAAESYEVTVLPSSIGKARQVLGSAAAPPPAAPAPAPVTVDDPPQYGERLPQPADPAAQPVAGGPEEPVAPEPQEPVGEAPEPAGPGEPAPGPDPDAPPVPPATRPQGA